jgi:putative phosphoribosyl transferase
MPAQDEGLVHVTIGPITLDGNLLVPAGASGIVLFAHGSGSSRFSSRNRYVASVLRDANLGTLLIDLLTPREEQRDNITAELRFDIGMLADRLVGTADWLRAQHAHTKIGLFGASTGGGAALVAAAERPELVHAVVSRGGRPDLAGAALGRVRAPTLLVVGGDDGPVVALNQRALAALECSKRLTLIPRATHLFSEPGALESVAELARDWFLIHLGASIPLASGEPAPSR